MKTLILAVALSLFSPMAYAQIPTLRPVASSTAPAGPSASIFAAITGQRAGAIKGEVTQKGREGLHQILDIELGVLSPRDPATGQATGKRQHKPLRILKRVTSASPQLFTAIATNESLPAVRLDFYEANRFGTASAAGMEVLVQTVTLQNASIASWRQFIHPELGLVEEVQLAYQKITIENKPGKTTGQDDWQAGAR